MTKAEEAALRAFPIPYEITEEDKISLVQSGRRRIYANGYSQAEQDLNIEDMKREWYNKGYIEGRKNAHIPARKLGLPKEFDFQQNLALTWEDIRTICALSVTVEVQLGREISDEQHYGEVLRRFNKTRD